MLTEHEREALCTLYGQMRKENLMKHGAALIEGINLFHDYIRQHFHMSDIEAFQLLEARKQLTAEINNAYSSKTIEAMKAARDRMRHGGPQLHLVKG